MEQWIKQTQKKNCKSRGAMEFLCQIKQFISEEQHTYENMLKQKGYIYYENGKDYWQGIGKQVCCILLVVGALDSFCWRNSICKYLCYKSQCKPTKKLTAMLFIFCFKGGESTHVYKQNTR